MINIRIHILSVSCLVVLLLYWFVGLIVFLPWHCWTRGDFWTSKAVLVDPFSAFALVFCCLLLWGLLELFFAVKAEQKRKYMMSVSIACVFITISFLAMHFTHIGFALIALPKPEEIAK